MRRSSRLPARRLRLMRNYKRSKPYTHSFGGPKRGVRAILSAMLSNRVTRMAILDLASSMSGRLLLLLVDYSSNTNAHSSSACIVTPSHWKVHSALFCNCGSVGPVFIVHWIFYSLNGNDKSQTGFVMRRLRHLPGV